MKKLRKKSLVGWMNRFPEWKDMGWTTYKPITIYHPAIFKKSVIGMAKVRITIEQIK